jgi:hypothetical protein
MATGVNFVRVAGQQQFVRLGYSRCPVFSGPDHHHGLLLAVDAPKALAVRIAMLACCPDAVQVRALASVQRPRRRSFFALPRQQVDGPTNTGVGIIRIPLQKFSGQWVAPSRQGFPARCTPRLNRSACRAAPSFSSSRRSMMSRGSTPSRPGRQISCERRSECCGGARAVRQTSCPTPVPPETPAAPGRHQRSVFGR